MINMGNDAKVSYVVHPGKRQFETNYKDIYFNQLLNWYKKVDRGRPVGDAQSGVIRWSIFGNEARPVK